MADSTETTYALTRREIVRRALVTAGVTSLVGSTTLLTTACSYTQQRTSAAAATGFTAEQIAWLDEVAETILPQTQTPGAKAAEVGPFIALMVTDTYSPEKQVQFAEAMERLESECQAAHNLGFMVASAQQRHQLLTRIDGDRQRHTGSSPHYFHALKELTVLGYFTSEIGYNQALRYVEAPGRYEPCVEYVAGERYWARHG